MFEHLTRNPLFEHPKPDLGFYPASTVPDPDLPSYLSSQVTSFLVFQVSKQRQSTTTTSQSTTLTLGNTRTQLSSDFFSSTYNKIRADTVTT
jgi:hypothetical protein